MFFLSSSEDVLFSNLDSCIRLYWVGQVAVHLLLGAFRFWIQGLTPANVVLSWTSPLAPITASSSSIFKSLRKLPCLAFLSMSCKYSLNLHNEGAVFFTEEIEVMLLAALTRSPLSAQIHWRYFCSSGRLLPFIDPGSAETKLFPLPHGGCIFGFWNLYFESPVWPTVCGGSQFIVIVGDGRFLKWVIQPSFSVMIFKLSCCWLILNIHPNGCWYWLFSWE